MPREFIAPDGKIFFRTKLMPFEQAESFARCLTANVTRFCDVDRLLSEKAKGDRCYFVQFRPVNPERQWEQIERQNSARLFRGMDEGPCYIFALDTDGPRPYYWIFNPLSGETYQTDSFGCSCPDYQFRCKKLAHAALQCKHMHALCFAMENGIIESLSAVLRSPEWMRKRYGVTIETPCPAAPARIAASNDNGAAEAWEEAA